MRVVVPHQNSVIKSNSKLPTKPTVTRRFSSFLHPESMWTHPPDISKVKGTIKKEVLHNKMFFLLLLCLFVLCCCCFKLISWLWKANIPATWCNCSHRCTFLSLTYPEMAWRKKTHVFSLICSFSQWLITSTRQITALPGSVCFLTSHLRAVCFSRCFTHGPYFISCWNKGHWSFK